MTTFGRRKSVRSTRAKLRWPGRPPVGRREDRVAFWAAIARGLYPIRAAADARVSWVVGARWFRQAGGMPPIHRAPSAPPLSGRFLSFAEREVLAVLRAQGVGVRACARHMGRSASTISRELRRNAATRGGTLDYTASTAQWHADRAALRPKVAKLAANAALRHYVQERLAGVIATPSGTPASGPTVPGTGRARGRRQHRRWGRAWSPEQIARRLVIDFPDAPTMRISPEAIYQALYIQARGALRHDLTACLRTGRAIRVPIARTRTSGRRVITPDLMISARPAEIADRAVPGHWEGDLILGLDSSAIGTLVARTTRFTMLLHLPRMAAHAEGARTTATKHGPPVAGHGATAVRAAISRVM